MSPLLHLLRSWSGSRMISPSVVEPAFHPRGMKAHERHQGKHLWPLRVGIFCKQTTEPHGLLDQVAPDQLLGAGRIAAFVEQEVDRIQDRIDASPGLLSHRDLQAHRLLPEELPGAEQSLGNRLLGYDERPGNFGSPEPAESLQDDGDLACFGDPGGTAGEHHSQHVSLGVHAAAPTRVGNTFIVKVHMDHATGSAENVDGLVPRHAEEPGGRLVRHALIGPDLHGPQESLLNDVFRGFQIFRSENPRQGRDHLSRLTAKKMVHQAADVSFDAVRQHSRAPLKGPWRQFP